MFEKQKWHYNGPSNDYNLNIQVKTNIYLPTNYKKKYENSFKKSDLVKEKKKDFLL